MAWSYAAKPIAKDGSERGAGSAGAGGQQPTAPHETAGVTARNTAAMNRAPWAAGLSNGLIGLGLLLLLGAGLMPVRTWLAGWSQPTALYLHARADGLVLPAGPTALPTAPAVVATPAPTPEPGPPAVVANAHGGPVVRLVIPDLGVDRTVVSVGMKTAGQVDFETERLFATQNRPDLVGQPVISTNPGDGGNVILIGHNYDNGYYQWAGVFLKLKTLQPGALVQVFTQDGLSYSYRVERVKQIPWSGNSATEREKHWSYLGPEPGERLTLVTCGGAIIGAWEARVYVVALPVTP